MDDVEAGVVKGVGIFGHIPYVHIGDCPRCIDDFILHRSYAQHSTERHGPIGANRRDFRTKGMLFHSETAREASVGRGRRGRV